MFLIVEPSPPAFKLEDAFPLKVVNRILTSVRSHAEGIVRAMNHVLHSEDKQVKMLLIVQEHSGTKHLTRRHLSHLTRRSFCGVPA